MVLFPFVFPCAWLLKIIRKAGVQNLPLCKKALLSVGVFPITNHYYEPQFDMRKTTKSFSQERTLPGINWNVQEQLKLLDQLVFSVEIEKFLTEKKNNLTFDFENNAFRSGDAEC